MPHRVRRSASAPRTVGSLKICAALTVSPRIFLCKARLFVVRLGELHREDDVAALRIGRGIGAPEAHARLLQTPHTTVATANALAKLLFGL